MRSQRLLFLHGYNYGQIRMKIRCKQHLFIKFPCIDTLHATLQCLHSYKQNFMKIACASQRERDFCEKSLIFQSHCPQPYIRPGIADQIGSVILPCIDLRGEGQKGLCHIGVGTDGTDHDNRKFGKEGVSVG